MAHLHIFTMELSTITPHIEALVFASDKPISISDLTDLINNALSFMDDKAETELVSSGVDAIREKYDSDSYAFGLKESGGGYQFLTKPTYYKSINQLQINRSKRKLSQAAMETLSIIAFKQPVTKLEIEQIRGVNCDYTIQKLLEKDLISITGKAESVGKPLLYGTSSTFMDYFGINTSAELPQLKDLPTEINEIGDYKED